MKNLFLALLLLVSMSAFSQTANDPASYLPYSGKFAYGINPGWYSTNWNTQQVVKLGSNAGAGTVRVPIYDDFLSSYGLTAELPDFKYYASLGMTELTAFVGSPSPAHKDSASLVFAGLYEPIWINGDVNPKNYFAAYLKNVISVYGPYVKFWEIVNEPDFTYSGGGWLGDVTPVQPGSWFDHNPLPDDLPNLRTSVFQYIRMLHIAWDVIKHYSPNSYVCTGGIGARSFLDALLRNTDNPVDGSTSANFPLKAGAYFDVISFHSYPEYQLHAWDPKLSKVVYFRHSDAALNMGYLWVKNSMDSIARRYGYDGKTYPQKQYICTETNVGRVMDGDSWGSADGAINYLLKCLVASQKAGVRQLYVYQLGDGATAYQFDQMGLYPWIGNNHPGDSIKLNPEGIAFKTISSLLQGSYDSSITFPSGIDGGAFKKADGSYIYVLWAKTTIDMSEAASAAYTLPGAAIRKEWDYAQTGTSAPVSGAVMLNGRPSFFELQAATPVKKVLMTIRVYTDGSVEKQ